jgi:hypothetical protein
VGLNSGEPLSKIIKNCYIGDPPVILPLVNQRYHIFCTFPDIDAALIPRTLFPFFPNSEGGFAWVPSSGPDWESRINRMVDLISVGFWEALFAFFGSAPSRKIYDHTREAIDTFRRWLKLRLESED